MHSATIIMTYIFTFLLAANTLYYLCTYNYNILYSPIILSKAESARESLQPGIPLQAPTIFISHLPVNGKLNTGECDFSYFKNRRNSTQHPYGLEAPTPNASSFEVFTNPDQFSLDDLLYTQISDYPLRTHLAQSADFIFLPIRSALLQNTSHCNDEVYIDSVESSILEIRKYIASFGAFDYPRFILPIATVRSAHWDGSLKKEIAKELGNKVVLISIESASLRSEEDHIKTLIDAPYPSRFHFNQDDKQRWKKEPIPNYYLNLDRPYLFSYSGSNSHPWNIPSDEIVTGFKLRPVIKKTIDNFLKLNATTPRIHYDDFPDHNPSIEYLMAIYDHMAQSIFCLQPPGDTPSRQSFNESIHSGCIPVIFRNTSYGRLFPSSEEMETSQFTVFIPEYEIIEGIGPNLIERLSLISKVEIWQKQEHIAKITRKLQWSYPNHNISMPVNSTRIAQNKHRKAPSFDDDAFGMILKELATIKSGQWKNRSESGLFDDFRTVRWWRKQLQFLFPFW